MAEHPKINILFSYAFRKSFDLQWLADHTHRFNIVVDSGAFTAHSLGRPIVLADYLAWLRDLPFKPEFAIQLDIIGDADASLRNYLAALDAGVMTVPVITSGASEEQVAAVLALEPERICIGGVARAKTPVVLAACARLKRLGVDMRRAHILGRATQSEMVRVRPQTCDSSTPTMSRCYGRMSLYDGTVFRQITRRDVGVRGLSPSDARVVWSTGIDPSSLSQESSWRGEDSLAMTVGDVAWIRYCRDIGAKVGTSVYDAIVNVNFAKHLLGAFDLFVANEDRWRALKASGRSAQRRAA